MMGKDMDNRTMTNEQPQAMQVAATDAAPMAKPVPSKKIKASPRTIMLMVPVFVLGMGVILYAWQLGPFNSAVKTTNDSYVRGQMTVLAPQVSGYVVEVLVKDYERVTQGQPILKIDDRIYTQQVAEAEAQLDLAVAQEAQSAAELARIERLSVLGASSASNRDQAVATHSVNAAQVKQAQAKLDLAKINLSNTVVYAPRSGQLGEASVRLGQYVTAGTQVVFLVPDSLWVVANFKESQTHKMAVGQHVTFTVDALDHAAFRGRVEDLAPATGSEFSVLRPDNASGNFTKVVQRIPVRIAIDPSQTQVERLRPGLSVVTSVDTASGGK
jgi:multidrug resistance efflux pump